jgi:hypothetical protein
MLLSRATQSSMATAPFVWANAVWWMDNKIAGIKRVGIVLMASLLK